MKIEKRLHKALKISTKEEQYVAMEQNKEWDGINKILNSLVLSKEDLIKKNNENYLKISTKKETVRLLNEKQTNLEKELNQIEKRIKQGSVGFDFEGLRNEKEYILRGSIW